MAEEQIPGRSNSRIALLALALAICGSASMCYYHLGLFIPRMLESRAASGLGRGYAWGDDFHPVWLTARQAIISHRDPYSPASTRDLQIGVFGRPLDSRNPHDPPPGYREFAYPAYVDLVMWPVALLPFPQLRALLAALLPLLLVIVLGLWLRALDWKLGTVWFLVLVLLTLSSYQMLEALFAEQLGVFSALFLAGAAFAIRKQQLLLAGSLASLTLIKPETSSLAIFFLLLWSVSDRRRARFWQGFAIVSLALMGGSLWVWPHWISEWIHIVLGYTRYAMPPLIQVLLGKSVPDNVGKAICGCFVVAGLWLAWRNRGAIPDSPTFWFTLSLVLTITSLAVLPGQAIYDHTILLPAILLIVRGRRTLMEAGWLRRAMLVTGAGILFWPWIAALVLLTVRPFLAANTFYSTPVFALPIRTAAVLPFAVAALLWLSWRLSSGHPEHA